MKFLKVALVSSLFLTGVAHSAPIVKVKAAPNSFNINLSSANDQLFKVATSPISIFTAGTTESTSAVTTAYLASYSWSGIKQWESQINNESIGVDLIKDSNGGLLLYGAAVSTDSATISNVSDTATLNPDGVNVAPTYSPNNSLTNIVVWKFSSTGQLVANYILPFADVVFPKNITEVNKKFILSGYSKSKYFNITFDTSGSFGKVSYPREPIEKFTPSIYKFGTNKITYFLSSSAISGVTGWKPKRPIPVLIERAKSGAIKIANYFPGNIVSTAYQSGSGFVSLNQIGLQYGISIITPIK